MSEIKLVTLTKHFGEVKAVQDLSLVADHGSFIALLGPSGCGKTTTMNMIAGLERPTSGEIYFDGVPISKLAPGDRNVGFVFQNYAIFTHMTVYENLAFGLRMRKPRPAKTEIDRDVLQVAETVGLSGALDRRAARLSVNDLQKVALGRSMIVQPAIFLLDEPFSNLDAAFRAYMRAELKRIQHEVGQTMVYVTHDQVEAMGMADRIAVMNLGELQQYGTPDELYNRPANRFVANFIGSVLCNFMPVQFETRDGSCAVVLRGPEGGSIDVSDRRDAIEGRPDAAGTLTLSCRPERIRIVPADSPEATIRAKVTLIEPLGAKDVVHLSYEGYDVRTVASPGDRPRVGENLGLVLEADAVHVFDDETGLALR
jgi:multiple sugar transport system ATP-binding protein